MIVYVKEKQKKYFENPVLKYLPVFAVIMSAFMIFSMPGDKICAGVGNATDYCYQRDVVIRYTGSGTITNQAIRIPTDSNSLINNGYVGSNVWEILGIQGSLSNSINILAQDITSSTSGWWYQIPSISAGNTVTLRLYMQNPEQQRDQGILFTGNDSMSVSHAPILNITNNLDIGLDLMILDGDKGTATSTLINHYDSASTQGYKWELIPIPGSDNLVMRTVIDNSACDVVIASSDFNEADQYRFKFNTPNIIVEKNGSVLNTCNTGLASITGVSEPLTVGTNLSHTVIRNINLLDTNTLVGRWIFEPSAMTETSALDPIYQGTATDHSVNNLDLTYTFNRPQTDYVVENVSRIVEVGSSTIIPLPDGTINVIGVSPFGGSISTPVPGETTGVFYDIVTKNLITGSGGIDAPSGMVMTILLGGLGMFFAIFVFMKTTFIPLSLFVAGIPLAFGAINGWVAFWIPIFFALLVVLSWFALRGADSY